MKKFGLIVLLIIAKIGMAQSPETVYSIAKEQRPIEWYAKQEKLWKTELDRDKRNAVAWLNYYEAIRAQWILGGWISEGEDNLKDKLDDIVNQCYAKIPNSFEANYMMYRHFNNLTEPVGYFANLQRAYEISPLDARTYENFIVHYELKGMLEERNKFVEKYFKANQIASSVYNWAYNLLAELDENAILFTCGDNDTYSVWGVQVVKKFRPDVTVINTSLMLVDDYRISKLEKLGINTADIQLDSVESRDEFEKRKKEIFTRIFTNKRGLPVYVASSAVFEFEENFGDNLYLTGLAYLYAENELDNIALIRRNYEKRYLLDYLTMTFAFNIQDNIADQLNATYLPAFVKLYCHYSLMEDEQAKERLKRYLTEISKKSGQYDTIMDLIKDC